MTPALEAALVRDFPGLFADYGKPITETCISWGCECGPGWEPIIRRACEKLAVLKPPPVLDQVKEKYGGLQIYFHGGPWGRRRWYWPALWCAGLWSSFRHDALRNWRNAAYFRSYDGATDTAGAVTDAAEAESYRTCEACGRPGHPNKYGWISTLCDSCRTARS